VVDVYGLGGVRREDAAGVRASQAAVEELLAREKKRGIPASRLVLAGFSQGGAIALQTGLRHPSASPGSWRSPRTCRSPTRSPRRPAANRDVPIFMAHVSTTR